MRLDPSSPTTTRAGRQPIPPRRCIKPLLPAFFHPQAITVEEELSIFGKIKTAIFGEHGPLGGQFSGRKTTPPQTTAAESHPASPPPPPQAPSSPAASATPAAAAPAQAVDVEQVLTGIAQSKGNPNLNWRTSIVDLMKLLDLDSSLDNRKELATELGYSGAKDGSAEMNIWLHKAVMRELEKAGGRVPASLKD